MSINLSNKDIAILKLLQQDAGISTGEIARRLNMSQSPCWRRIRRLQEAGVIRKQVALLDSDKLGMDVIVFTSVNLNTHGRQSLEEFELEIEKFPEVLECYTLTGTMDYMLKIITRNIHHYEQFVRNELSQMPHVREIHSNVSVTQIKCTTELPLDTQLQ